MVKVGRRSLVNVGRPLTNTSALPIRTVRPRAVSPVTIVSMTFWFADEGVIPRWCRDPSIQFCVFEQLSDAVCFERVGLDGTKLHVHALAPQGAPADTEAARAALSGALPTIHLPELMLEVDASVRFSWILLGREPASERHFLNEMYGEAYFCGPYSPWQRGSNENTNGLLRQYFPKETDLSGYSQSDLHKVALRLNQRPRETLGFQTPAAKLRASVAPIH